MSDLLNDPALHAFLDLCHAHAYGITFPPDIEAEAYAAIDASPRRDFMRPWLASLDDREELERLYMQTHIRWLTTMVSHGADEQTIDERHRRTVEAVTGVDPGPSMEG